MTELLINDWGALALPAAGSIVCLATALVISSVVSINRGAKANLAWMLIALSFICFGVVEGDRVLVILGLPNIGGIADLLKLIGFFSALFAASYTRGLLKRLSK